MRPTGPRMNERIRISHSTHRRERRTGRRGRDAGCPSTPRDLGMDLVEMAADNRPPVCRIMDWPLQVRAVEGKGEQTKTKTSELKEVRLGRSMKIDPHDIAIRMRQARQFLLEGHKVQIVQQFRGREMAHRHRGDERMRDIIADSGSTRDRAEDGRSAHERDHRPASGRSTPIDGRWKPRARPPRRRIPRSPRKPEGRRGGCAESPAASPTPRSEAHGRSRSRPVISMTAAHGPRERGGRFGPVKQPPLGHELPRVSGDGSECRRRPQASRDRRPVPAPRGGRNTSDLDRRTVVAGRDLQVVDPVIRTVRASRTCNPKVSVLPLKSGCRSSTPSRSYRRIHSHHRPSCCNRSCRSNHSSRPRAAP